MFLLALLMMYSGVMHFKYAPFVAQIVPAWMPARLFWAYFTGVALFASGVSFIARKYVGLASLLLGILLSSFVLLIHGPSMFHSMVYQPRDAAVLWSFNGTGGVNNALKDVALTLAAFLLAAADRSQSGSLQPRIVNVLGRSLAGLMILFGIEHFFFLGYTPGIPSWSMVNFWIPGRLFWGYGTGAFLLAAGVMILSGWRARGAAVALGAMVLAVAVCTYAFRMAGHVANVGELTNTVKDVAVAGGAFILSGMVSDKDLSPAADRSSIPAAHTTVGGR